MSLYAYFQCHLEIMHMVTKNVIVYWIEKAQKKKKINKYMFAKVLQASKK